MAAGLAARKLADDDFATTSERKVLEEPVYSEQAVTKSDGNDLVLSAAGPHTIDNGLTDERLETHSIAMLLPLVRIISDSDHQRRMPDPALTEATPCAQKA
jgi:hypothetical protein